MSEPQRPSVLHTIVFKSGRVVRITANEIQSLPTDEQTFVVRDGVLVATLANAEVAAIFHATVDVA